MVIFQATFTILSCDKVDLFLQHLNSQQPTIRFTMETETNNTIPFLDTLVTTSLPVFTESLHIPCVWFTPPTICKRGIDKCLYDR